MQFNCTVISPTPTRRREDITSEESLIVVDSYHASAPGFTSKLHLHKFKIKQIMLQFPLAKAIQQSLNTASLTAATAVATTTTTPSALPRPSPNRQRGRRGQRHRWSWRTSPARPPSELSSGCWLGTKTSLGPVMEPWRLMLLAAGWYRKSLTDQ